MEPEPIIRELTYEDRMRWGKCPVCGAGHLEFCYSDVGIQMGRKVDGSRMQDGEGAHLARLRLAPDRVKEVPV